MHVFTNSLNPYYYPIRKTLSPFPRWQNWATERLNNLPVITQLAFEMASVWTQAVWLYCPCSSLYLVSWQARTWWKTHYQWLELSAFLLFTGSSLLDSESFDSVNHAKKKTLKNTWYFISLILILPKVLK